MKLATRSEAFLKLHARRFAVIATAGTSIKAGQLISATGPGPMLEAGDSMLAMEEFDQAIASFDIVIEQFPGTEAALAAMNNKGICYLRQKKLDEAIAILALFTDDKAPYNTDKIARQTAIRNLTVCYAQKGDSSSTSSTLTLLREAFPDTTDFEAFTQVISETLSSLPLGPTLSPPQGNSDPISD